MFVFRKRNFLKFIIIIVPCGKKNIVIDDIIVGRIVFDLCVLFG